MTFYIPDCCIMQDLWNKNKFYSVLFYFTHNCLDRLRKTITPSLSRLHTTATLKQNVLDTGPNHYVLDQCARSGSCHSVQTVRLLSHKPTSAPSVLSTQTNNQ